MECRLDRAHHPQNPFIYRASFFFQCDTHPLCNHGDNRNSGNILLMLMLKTGVPKKLTHVCRASTTGTAPAFLLSLSLRDAVFSSKKAAKSMTKWMKWWRNSLHEQLRLHHVSSLACLAVFWSVQSYLRAPMACYQRTVRFIAM